jgi:hypothetical protein
MVMEIFSFDIKNHQVDFTFKKGFIAYTFEHDGKSYGNKIKVPSRGVMDIASAVILATVSICESLDNLK